MPEEFGTTAWGRDWVRLAQPIRAARPDPALPRARSLTRNDRVRDVTLDAGQVRATVVDGGERHVHIAVPTWDSAQQSAASALLAGTSLGGDLPDDVHAGLVRAGLPLAPAPASLTSECSCPSRKPTCPHLLAVCFEVARRIDERPAAALALRGLEVHTHSASDSRIPLGRIDATTFYDTRPRG